MNKRQAEQEGYLFQGAYGRNKEEIKARAKVLRDAGNKAVVVEERDNPLSRGPRGTGYSVYWIESEANKAARQEADRLKRVAVLQRDIKLQQEKVLDLRTKLVGIMTPAEFSEWSENE